MLRGLVSKSIGERVRTNRLVMILVIASQPLAPITALRES